MINFFRWLFGVDSRMPKESKVRKQWLPAWSGIGKWTSGDEVVKTAHYTVRYYPDTHTVKLKCKGYMWKDHTMYSTAITALNELTIWLTRFDREWMIAWIHSNRDDRVKMRSKNLSNDLESLSIPELENLIQEKLREEKYLEIPKIQDVLNKKIDNDEI